MNARLAVIRFSNEDVIATSAGGGGSVIIVPDGVCAQLGTVHFFTTGRGRYDAAADATTATGIGYLYTAPGELTYYAQAGNTMTLAGQVSIPAGRFFYFNGESYTLCEPQAHIQ